MSFREILSSYILFTPKFEFKIWVSLLILGNNQLITSRQLALYPNHMDDLRDNSWFVPARVRLKLVARIEDCKLAHRHPVLYKMINIPSHSRNILFKTKSGILGPIN